MQLTGEVALNQADTELPLKERVATSAVVEPKLRLVYRLGCLPACCHAAVTRIFAAGGQIMHLRGGIQYQLRSQAAVPLQCDYGCLPVG